MDLRRTPLATALVLALMLLSLRVRAQDPIFSQYTASAVHANPGMLGLFDGAVKASINYRDQWSSTLGSHPLRTMAAAGELRYNVAGRDFVGVGVTALQDEGGQAGFRQSRIGVGASLQKFLAGGRGRNATVVGFGGRIGYGQNALTGDGLWFSSDIDTSTLVIEPDGGGFGPGFTGVTRGFLDLSAGGNLAIVRKDYSLTVGLAGHHLNWPGASFVNDDRATLGARYSALVTFEYLLDDGLRLMPSIAYERQRKSDRLMGGGGLYYMPGGEGDAGFRMSAYGRMANRLDRGMYLEAIVLVGQIEFNRLVAGISYDINTGAVGRAVDGRGAYEVSLSWTQASRSRYKVVCPKF